MEDEAADQRAEQNTADGPSRQAHLAYQAIAGTSSQQTTEQVVALAPGVSHCGTSSTWQQKVLDVEAKLQGDLQQDLAKSVLETISDEEANPSSA
jgi:hypothetical protein